MRIAFDLDDTLIPGRIPFEREPAPRGLLRRHLSVEPLRLGTVWLFQRLRQLGHETWIYTTSFRRPLAIKLSFWAYGAPVRGVVNQDIHLKAMAELGGECLSCSKYPPAFGFDVLVDDSEGVLMEARKFGFKAILVRPDDPYWLETVIAGLGLSSPA
jgi:hypothetical protein